MIELGLADIEKPAPQHDAVLLEEARQNDHRNAFLCLRCRVSWPLEQKVRALHRQFGRGFGVELVELAAFALDDLGRLLPFLPENATAAKTAPNPFTVEVIRSYDPQLSSLSHWARQKLDGRNDLKAYLKQQGVLLIGDWALLGDSSHKQVQEATERLNGNITPEAAVKLHRCYLPLYRREKLLYRQVTHRQRGWEPGEAFFKELAPNQAPAETYRALKEIAAAVRALRTGRWQKAASDLLDGGLISAWDGDLENEEPDRSALQGEDGLQESWLLELLETVGTHYIAEMFKQMPKRDEAWAYWQGWAEGLTTRAIARRCGAPQARVSRRLNTRARADEIATSFLARLKTHPGVQQEARLASILSSSSQQDQAATAVVNHILRPEQEGDIPPMRRWILESLQESGAWCAGSSNA